MQETPTFKWPYSELGDDPRSFPTLVDRPRTLAIENALVDVRSTANAANNDTGWVTVPGTGNWTANSDISIRRTGRNDIFLNAKFQALGDIATGTHGNIAFIPEQYRPTRDLTFSAALRRSGQTIEYWASVIVRIIAATGQVIAYTEHSGNAIFLTTSWPR